MALKAPISTKVVCFYFVYFLFYLFFFLGGGGGGGGGGRSHALFVNLINVANMSFNYMYIRENKILAKIPNLQYNDMH